MDSTPEATLAGAAFTLAGAGSLEQSLDIGVDRFKTAPCRIEFVPEADPPSVLQKLLPPFAMGFCPCEAFKRFKIAPILAHLEVQRKERVEDIFVKNKPSGRAATEPSLNRRSTGVRGGDPRSHVGA
jgi:hypothetical protein